MSADLQAENDQLKASNRKLAELLKNMGDKLEEGRRGLLATGWDALADRLASDSNGVPAAYVDSLKADNPYRKPVVDLSGAMFCKLGDDS